MLLCIQLADKLDIKSLIYVRKGHATCWLSRSVLRIISVIERIMPMYLVVGLQRSRYKV